MIPKVIHYCWFGGKPLPHSARKCIDSWYRVFPDYDVKEWNETNFDVSSIPYTKLSYKAGKFAFISDYARYKILYNYGGFYFDTDVEVVKPFSDIIETGPFLGIEKNRDIISVNPGLAMAAYPGMSFYREMLDRFEEWKPEKKSEDIQPLLVRKTTELLQAHGFKLSDEIQTVEGITIYPNDYFNPKDDYTGRILMTQNTVSIHHYAKSWIDNYSPLQNKLVHLYHRVLKLIQRKTYTL